MENLYYIFLCIIGRYSLNIIIIIIIISDNIHAKYKLLDSIKTS